MIALIIMAIVQGLTEFIPVSSSGHLLFIQSLFNIKGINLTIDIFLHLATFVVVIIYFLKDILNIIKDFINAPFDFKQGHTRIFYMIILTSIPTGIIGYILSRECFRFIFEQSSILLITWTVTAILLIISDRIDHNKQTLEHMTIQSALIIGLAQGIAIFPGISHSGTTIIVALLLGFNRRDSFKYSFLAGVPAILGASIIGLVPSESSKVVSFDLPVFFMIFIFIVAVIFGLCGILILKKLLNSRKFKFFGFYLILMVLILIIQFLIKIN